MTQNNKDINAILLGIYLWMFMILRVVWSFNDTYSTPILGLCAIVIMLTSLLKTKNYINLMSLKSFFMIFIMIIMIFISISKSNNSIVYTRLYEFLIYGVIPVSIFSQIRDFKPFLDTYVKLSVIIFLIYILDPLNQYFLTGSYMVYGFQAILPAFFGIHIGKIKTGKKVYLLLEIISIICLIFFANRMSILSAILFIIVINLFYEKFTVKKIIGYSIAILATIIIILNFTTILKYAVNMLNQLGYNSYSLNSTLLYLQGNNFSFDAGRNIIWKEALEFIKLKPITGVGIGYFESVYGLYSHNIFIDFLLSFGLIGLSMMLLLLINSMLKLGYQDKDTQLVGILLLLTSFPKLLTSIYFFIEPTFWLFLIFGVFIPYYDNYKNKKEAMGIHEKIVK